MPFYIPPEGLRFRIVGYASNCAIYSRNSPKPEVGHYNISHGDYADQWFSLLHGIGNHKGLYAIKGYVSGKVLYSRSEKPTVGHIDGNGQHEDNWFKLEPAAGQYTDYCRLITPSEGLTLYSRISHDPTFGNHSDKNFHENQLFKLIWEDIKVDKVDFNLDAGKILSSNPITLAEQVLTNHFDSEQQMSFSVSKTVTNTSSFEYGEGFTVSAGLEFIAGIPNIVEGKFTVEASTNRTWKWGETTSYSTQYTATFPVKVGPHQSVRAIAFVNYGTLEVPYVMHLSSRSSGARFQTSGTWRGISSWDLRCTTTAI